MPRTSSFSVRDILDLPQMKTSSDGSVTTAGVETDALSHATDLYAAASAQRLQGESYLNIFFHHEFENFSTFQLCFYHIFFKL